MPVALVWQAGTTEILIAVGDDGLAVHAEDFLDKIATGAFCFHCDDRDFGVGDDFLNGASQ